MVAESEYRFPINKQYVFVMWKTQAKFQFCTILKDIDHKNR